MDVEPQQTDREEVDEDEYEDHEVPFGMLHVQAFGSQDLCNAVRMFWRPTLRLQRDPLEEAREAVQSYTHGPDFEGFAKSLEPFRERLPEHAKKLRDLQEETEYVGACVRKSLGNSETDDVEEGEEITVNVSRLREADPSGKRYTTVLHDLLQFVPTEGEIISFGATYKSGPLVQVRIVLDYPLTNVWEHVATIPSSEFGRVFEIGYLMYRYIYELDDSAWQAAGHQDSVPRVHPQMINRARGEYVWGHDMSDLVFEGMLFRPEPDIKPLPKQAAKWEPPLIGTVRFSIGS